MLDGLSIVCSGDCKTAKSVSLTIHILINFPSTLLLAASNYAMQVASSPSRADIDKAATKIVGYWRGFTIEFEMDITSTTHCLHITSILIDATSFTASFCWFYEPHLFLMHTQIQFSIVTISANYRASYCFHCYT